MSSDPIANTLILTGPTASGKSALALELAERGRGAARFLTSAPDEEDIVTALDRILEDWAAPVLAGLRLA